MILLSIAFPVVVALMNHKKQKQVMELATLLLWGVSFLIELLFIEDGARMKHGNYLWGLFFATFVWYIVSIKQYVENIIDQKHNRAESRSRIRIVIESILFGSGIICGIYTFGMMVFG